MPRRTKRRGEIPGQERHWGRTALWHKTEPLDHFDPVIQLKQSAYPCGQFDHMVKINGSKRTVDLLVTNFVTSTLHSESGGGQFDPHLQFLDQLFVFNRQSIQVANLTT